MSYLEYFVIILDSISTFSDVKGLDWSILFQIEACPFKKLYGEYGKKAKSIVY
jgi:hypothetical protein